MNTYCVSFRIAAETVGGKTYDERWESLVLAARKADAGFWDGTTSFFLVESGLDTNAFAKSLTAGLSKSQDMLVVFDPADMSMAYFGAVKETAALESFFKFRTKL